MNGVEILSTTQVASEFAFNWIACIIGFVIIFGFTLFLGIYTSNETNEKRFILLCLILGIICGSITGAIFGGLFSTPTAYETHYKVTIDDSVSMNEFLDKYEILDQEGKIYTVKERE